MTHDPLPQRAFVALLDELIPARNDSLPGAGSLGVGEYIESRLDDAMPLVVGGLAALDTRARERGASDFADLPREERAPLVHEVAAAQPGFVELLLFHAYAGYYQNPRVAVALGLKPEPAYPGGFELELGDLSRLDPVRQRAKIYREV